MACEPVQTGNTSETARQVDELIRNLISPHLEVKLLIQFKKMHKMKTIDINQHSFFHYSIKITTLIKGDKAEERRKNAFGLASKRNKSRKKSLIKFHSI